MQQLVALVLRDGAPEGVGQQCVHHQKHCGGEREPADLSAGHQCQTGGDLDRTDSSLDMVALPQ